MMSPYADRYSDELEDSGPVVQGIAEVLLTVSVTVWACIWGAIWLLSGAYVALHFGEDHPSPDGDLGPGEDQL